MRAWGGDQHKDLHFAVSCAFLLEDTQPQKYPLAAASTGFAWTALGVSIIGGILALSKRFKHRSVAAPLPAATPLSQQLHQALNRAPDSIKKHLQPDMITEANASQYLWLLSGATS